MAIRVMLKIDPVLDEASKASAIELAKRCAARTTRVDNSQDAVRAPMEAIPSAEDALAALVEYNPLLAQVGAKIERVGAQSKTTDSHAQLSQPGTRSAGMDGLGEGTPEDDLDEYDTGLYLCRWPNGDFSVVKADDRRGAMLELDEWAGAEPACLIPIDTCIIDFRLTNDARN